MPLAAGVTASQERSSHGRVAELHDGVGRGKCVEHLAWQKNVMERESERRSSFSKRKEVGEFARTWP